MSLKNKVTLFCAVTVLCFLVLVSFQNCGTNPNLNNFTGASTLGQITCEAKVFNSSNFQTNIYKAGDVINFYITSSQPGYMGQFLIKNIDGEIIKNEPFITPAFKQQIFIDESDLGDYIYQTQLQDSTGKTICETKGRQFKILQNNSNVTSCVFSVVSGDGQNFRVGDSVGLRVESFPSGLESFISGQNLNPAGSVTGTFSRTSQGLTPSEQTYITTAGDSGQWNRYAEVKSPDGSFVVCQPSQVLLKIEGSPVTPPTVTPPVTPPAASGTLSSNRTTCSSLAGESCGVALTWNTLGLPNAQVYETLNGTAYSYVGCGVAGSQSIFHNSISGTKTYTYKLLTANDCNVRYSDSMIASMIPLASVSVSWVYKSEITCPPGRVCIPR